MLHSNIMAACPTGRQVVVCSTDMLPPDSLVANFLEKAKGLTEMHSHWNGIVTPVQYVNSYFPLAGIDKPHQAAGKAKTSAVLLLAFAQCIRHVTEARGTGSGLPHLGFEWQFVCKCFVDIDCQ